MRFMYTTEHEATHYRHALTSGHLRERSFYKQVLAEQIIEAYGHADMPLVATLAETFTEISTRADLVDPRYGLSLREVMECAADLEALKTVFPEDMVTWLLQQDPQRTGELPQTIERKWVYRLADILGDMADAVTFAAPLAWIGLYGSEPITLLFRLADELRYNIEAARHARDIGGLMDAVGLKTTLDDILNSLRAARSTVWMSENFEWVLGQVGWANLAQAAAWPSRGVLAPEPANHSRPDDLDAEVIHDALDPPIQVLSAPAGRDLEVKYRGYAQISRKFVQGASLTTMDVAMVERLTFQRNANTHMTCRHVSTCPHAASQLCAGFLDPPHLGEDPADCWFIDYVSRRTGHTPADLWTSSMQ